MKYVYILKAGADHYKVGIAKSVIKRVESIQTGNAYKVYIVAVKLCMDAPSVEKSIHQKLASMSTSGGTEWFKLTTTDVIKACILLNTEPEINIYKDAELNELIRSIDTSVSKLVAQARSKSSSSVQVTNNVVAASVVDTPVPTPKRDREADDIQLYNDAIEMVTTENKASTSLLQRKLRIGYGRAARLIEELEEGGIVGPPDGSRPRQIIYSTKDRPQDLVDYNFSD
jgi:DNA segregation ATPase FtsK/SpoIIIE-like protein